MKRHWRLGLNITVMFIETFIKSFFGFKLRSSIPPPSNLESNAQVSLLEKCTALEHPRIFMVLILPSMTLPSLILHLPEIPIEHPFSRIWAIPRMRSEPAFLLFLKYFHIWQCVFQHLSSAPLEPTLALNTLRTLPLVHLRSWKARPLHPPISRVHCMEFCSTFPLFLFLTLMLAPQSPLL